MAMEDIARKATLLSGHTWDELKEMIDNRTYEPQPQIYSFKTVAIPEPPNVVYTTGRLVADVKRRAMAFL